MVGGSRHQESEGGEAQGSYTLEQAWIGGGGDHHEGDVLRFSRALYELEPLDQFPMELNGLDDDEFISERGTGSSTNLGEADNAHRDGERSTCSKVPEVDLIPPEKSLESELAAKPFGDIALLAVKLTLARDDFQLAQVPHAASPGGERTGETEAARREGLNVRAKRAAVWGVALGCRAKMREGARVRATATRSP